MVAEQGATSRSAIGPVSDDRWWPSWRDQVVVCIAGGPSLTRQDCRYVEQRRDAGACKVIGVNNAYRVCELDLLYAADHDWWDWHLRLVRETVNPRVLLVTQASAKCEHAHVTAPRHGLHWILGCSGEGLSSEPGLIHYGRNSGFQAVNLAYLFGARRIVLLGYDMQLDGGKAKHWFGEHPQELNRPSNYTACVRALEAVATQNLDVEILNCSRNTALTMFPCVSLEEALA